jgi:HAD superfamily hydrolase (TIGR01509 family)
MPLWRRNYNGEYDMQGSAIIFGGIGTLVETSDIQRVAFNDAFNALGIDYHWDEKAYSESLSATGGMARLSSIRLSDGTSLTQQQVGALHAQKTISFVKRLANSRLTSRPGVDALIDHAKRHGILLAWATTTSKINIDAVIVSTHGGLSRDMFDFIGDDTMVTRQKPDPQIYAICLKALNVSASQAMAIEDSVTGIEAAKSAGIRTVAFPGDFNVKKDFGLADEIVSSLSSLKAALT